MGLRYPGYHARVMEFIASGVIERLDQDLARAYVTYQSTRRPSIVLVMHTDPYANFIGGIEFHVRDIIADLGHEYIFYVLSPDRESIRVTASVDGVTTVAEWASDDYPALLRALNPSLIPGHDLMNHPPAFVEALTHWSGPKVFTIHDYAGLCPRYTLLNSHLDYCGVPAKDECHRCASRLFPESPLWRQRSGGGYTSGWWIARAWCWRCPRRPSMFLRAVLPSRLSERASRRTRVRKLPAKLRTPARSREAQGTSGG